MMAMLYFENGDRREITLDASHIRHGHPVDTIAWADENGERDFWLDVPAYRAHRSVRYREIPRTTSAKDPT